MSVRGLLDATAARSYALFYDRVVSGFAPYQALVDEIAAQAAGATTVLDACAGTGTLALALAAKGHRVVALEPMESLTAAARDRALPGVEFRAIDIAGELPWRDAYDFAASLNTLYWHPHPARVLAGLHQSLAPKGRAVVVNYQRPTDVLPTFRAVRRDGGLGSALSSLRWLLPTAAFELARSYRPHYTDEPTLRSMLEAAGFTVDSVRPVFLGGTCLMAVARRR